MCKGHEKRQLIKWINVSFLSGIKILPSDHSFSNWVSSVTKVSIIIFEIQRDLREYSFSFKFELKKNKSKFFFLAFIVAFSSVVDFVSIFQSSFSHVPLQEKAVWKSEFFFIPICVIII